jgi:predicted site-specific integrase-resolvase
MNLAAWAERNCVARVTAYRWFRTGLLPEVLTSMFARLDGKRAAQNQAKRAVAAVASDDAVAA